MTLTPLRPSTLNSKKPASPLSPAFFSTPMTSNKMAPGRIIEDDNVNWDEGTSSPFTSELTTDVKAAMAPVQQASPARRSPVKDILSEPHMSPSPQLKVKLEPTPFNICEDGTSMPPSEERPLVESALSPYRNILHDAVSAPAFPDGSSDIADSTFNDDGNVDDTCFSTFSEVPNTDMTTFARLGQRSPAKQGFPSVQQTPRPLSRNTPGTARTARLQTSRSPSPTPRRMAGVPVYQDSNDTTNLLLDFTEQFQAVSNYSQQYSSVSRRSPAKASGDPQLLSYLQNQRSPAKGSTPATPSTSRKNIMMNLLDFELPPAPTPRSVPTISIRELESLKSTYASQISSLKATLSGREAEVQALKHAVGDAERRVGEAMEGAREEKERRECIEKEKEEWERRGREFEDVLKKVKAEVLESEREKTDLAARADELDERLGEAEARASDAEARAAQAESSRVSMEASSSQAEGSHGPLFTAEQVQKQIDDKVHTLSTELHAIYKKKHVTKVAGLKKGFEAKTKEKTAELQARVDELEHQNEDLQAKIDGTLSGVLPTDLAVSGLSAEQREEERKRLEEQATLIERQKAELVGREEELKTARIEYAGVMKELERERVEKGELVAAVDEMLALQADVSMVNANPSAPSQIVEDIMKRSIGAGATRPTGLSRPGFGFGAPGQSKIAAPSSGLMRPQVGKSRMMSNIERMGSGRSD